MELDSKELTADGKICVTVKLKNVGDMRGKEVVQLYIRDKVSSAVRPVQELLAFSKIELDANESCEVRFQITEPSLRFWNAQNKLISEPGEFEVFVGYADHRFLEDTFRLI